LSDWQEREGIALVDRLELSGDETVLDAGCGTGRVTRHLVERLPRGRVIAVDVAPEMLEIAARTLDPERVDIVRVDLTELTLDDPVDAIVSAAVLHWVLDQDLLYERLHAALRPGGRLLAWYGGEGSHEVLYRAADAIASEELFAPHFDGWSLPIVWPSVDDTDARLQRCGFVDVECSIEPNVLEDVPVEYFKMLSLSIYLDELPPVLHDEFVERVLATQARPYATRVNRLYVEARRP
jgi:trans-aconitate 2-methyltransferase